MVELLEFNQIFFQDLTKSWPRPQLERHPPSFNVHHVVGVQRWYLNASKEIFARGISESDEPVIYLESTLQALKDALIIGDGQRLLLAPVRYREKKPSTRSPLSSLRALFDAPIVESANRELRAVIVKKGETRAPNDAHSLAVDVRRLITQVRIASSAPARFAALVKKVVQTRVWVDVKSF